MLTVLNFKYFAKKLLTRFLKGVKMVTWDLKRIFEHDRALDIKVANINLPMKRDENNMLKTGTTTVGIKCKNGVVLASESKATLGYLVASETSQKVYQIDEKMALTTAGGAGDTQLLVRLIKAEINLYKLMRNTQITVKAVTTLLSNLLQSSRVFPLMAMLIIGGHDSTGFHIYSIDPLGGYGEDDYTSTGSGSPVAYGVLEDGYKKEMDIKDGIKLAIRAISSAKKRDVFSGGEKLQVVVIDEKTLKFLSEQEVKNIIKV